jgi:hypothetical protein
MTWRPADRRRLLVAAAVLVALVPLGLYEGERRAGAEMRAMARMRAAVGPLDSPSLVGYRVLPGFDCLVYRRPDAPFALEVCFDGEGRLVEAIDRRSGRTEFASLRDDPAASTLRVDRREIDRLLRMMGAPCCR